MCSFATSFFTQLLARFIVKSLLRAIHFCSGILLFKRPKIHILTRLLRAPEPSRYSPLETVVQ